ncbi:MAG: RNA pseudouridine synthase [Spirochaetae bacterium HGW-Spirochaetae-5]|nr:MAG: RNA pseudouridine synthase [Spirochaetae bacterium HGW-Spirochaetae-5]
MNNFTRNEKSKDRIMESLVGENYHGLRLDIYLSRRFSYMSRTSWQKEITAGKLILNGSVILNVKKHVCSGDMIEYIAGEIIEPEVDSDFTVIFENENYLAVNKTGNLPVHPSGIFFRNTLVMLLEDQRGEKYYPVHRLDRETSGALLLGKNSAAASEVQKNFGKVGKEYLTIVRGNLKEGKFTVDTPIGPARDSLINKKREAYENGSESAITEFERISSTDLYSLVKASPVTGRMHQIRVHLKYAGYPIIGDKIYGDDETIYLDYIKSGDSDELAQRAGFTRCALHSHSFSFFDPFEKRKIKIIAGIPADMDLFLKNNNLE